MVDNKSLWVMVNCKYMPDQRPFCHVTSQALLRVLSHYTARLFDVDKRLHSKVMLCGQTITLHFNGIQ